MKVYKTPGFSLMLRWMPFIWTHWHWKKKGNRIILFSLFDLQSFAKGLKSPRINPKSIRHHYVIDARPMIIGKNDIDGFGVFFLFSAQHHQNMYNAQPLYLDQNKFYITTLFESKQFVHHHFIWITTSFTSPLYFDHNKFYIATLFESQHQGLPHYFNHNDCYITMFIAVLHHYFILTRTSFTSQ